MNWENKPSLKAAKSHTDLVAAEEPLIEQKETQGRPLIQSLRSRFHKAVLGVSLLTGASGCISSVRPPETYSTWAPIHQQEFERRDDKKLIVIGGINGGYLQVTAVYKGKVFHVQRIIEREVKHVEIETNGLGLELGLAGASLALGGLFVADGKSLWGEAKQEKKEGYSDDQDSKKTIRKALDARDKMVTGSLLLGAGLIMSGNSILTAIRAKDSETMTQNMRNEDTITGSRDEIFAAPNEAIYLQSGGKKFLLGYTLQNGGFQIRLSDLHRVVDLSIVLVARDNIQIVVGDATVEIALENFAQAIVSKEEWDLYKKSSRGDMESSFRYLAIYPQGYMFKEVQSYGDAVRKMRQKIELGLQAEGRNSYKEAQEELRMAKEILDYLKNKFTKGGIALPTELAGLEKNIKNSASRIQDKEHPPSPPITLGGVLQGLLNLTGRTMSTLPPDFLQRVKEGEFQDEAQDEADEIRRASEEGRQRKSMAKTEKALRLENEKLNKKLQKQKNKSQCDHRCKRDYQDSCGKGLELFGIRNNTRAECNNLYKNCLDVCYNRSK